MKIFCLIILLLISSCSDHSIKSYSDEFPKINLREFFNGLDAKFYGNLLMKYETTLIINYVQSAYLSKSKQ